LSNHKLRNNAKVFRKGTILTKISGCRFHKIWSDFVQKVRTSDEVFKVYVVVVDVRDAFGSVIHSKLIEILREVRKKLPGKLFLNRGRHRANGRFQKRCVFFFLMLTEKNSLLCSVTKGMGQN
jgi:hypothetical protein